MEDANTVSSAQPVPWELREQDGPDLVWSFSYLTVQNQSPVASGAHEPVTSLNFNFTTYLHKPYTSRFRPGVRPVYLLDQPLQIEVVSFARKDPQGLELSLKQSHFESGDGQPGELNRLALMPGGGTSGGTTITFLIIDAVFWSIPMVGLCPRICFMKRNLLMTEVRTVFICGHGKKGALRVGSKELRPVSQGAARCETGERRNKRRNIIQNLHFGLLPNLYAVWTLVTFANLPGHCFPAPIDKTSIKFAILAKIKNGRCQRCHYDDSPLRNGILRRVDLTKTYAPIPSMPRWRLSFSGLDGSTPFWVRVVQTEFTPPYDHRAYTYGSRQPEACTIRLAALKHGASLHYHQW
ncbi:hypothetical protein BKA82DRAFT_4018417 [Pisolithus tinctorius]|nr:hypothetical protein BKA82DRAFT_4018417 [Pisolithus tinctorius]